MVGAVVTGGVGAGGLTTGEAVGEGVVTGGPLGFADGGFGLVRFRAGELDRLGSVRAVAAGRTTTVGRTASLFTGALCG